MIPLPWHFKNTMSDERPDYLWLRIICDYLTLDYLWPFQIYINSKLDYLWPLKMEWSQIIQKNKMNNQSIGINEIIFNWPIFETQDLFSLIFSKVMPYLMFFQSSAAPLLHSTLKNHQIWHQFGKKRKTLFDLH